MNNSKKIYIIETCHNREEGLIFNFLDIDKCENICFPIIDDDGDVWINETDIIYYTNKNIIDIDQYDYLRYATKDEINKYKILIKLKKM